MRLPGRAWRLGGHGRHLFVLQVGKVYYFEREVNPKRAVEKLDVTLGSNDLAPGKSVRWNLNLYRVDNATHTRISDAKVTAIANKTWAADGTPATILPGEPSALSPSSRIDIQALCRRWWSRALDHGARVLPRPRLRRDGRMAMRGRRGCTRWGDTAALARRISREAPVETAPRRLRTMADVFVELGVTQLPEVDEWLHGIAQPLAGGPHLVTTLDSYYRLDMNRLNTAGALYIHLRTLDYRFGRICELVGWIPVHSKVCAF